MYTQVNSSQILYNFVCDTMSTSNKPSVPYKLIFELIESKISTELQLTTVNILSQLFKNYGSDYKKNFK